MSEITITPKVSWQEYNTCQDALWSVKSVQIAIWVIATIGEILLASSAALMWGTLASILAWLAFAAFLFGFSLSGQTTTALRRKTYMRYRESNPTYTFTDQSIFTTSRYGQSSVVWDAVDRVIDIRTVYLFAVGNSPICLPKRDIPPQMFDDFIQLLRTRRLLRQT